MKDNFKYTDLEKLLINDDFCDWVFGKKPELEEFYHDKLKQFPEKTEIVHKAISILKALNEDQLNVPLSRKIEIWEAATKKAKVNKKIPLLIQFSKYAAVFVVSALLTTVVYNLINTDEYDTYNQCMSSAPSSSSLTETKLILGNGEEIEIRTEEANIIYKNDGAQVEVNGKKEYDLETKDKVETASTYNQVIVPYGRKSKIVLPDSSVVWLNAGSRLVYPSPFEKDTRTLFLEGEGFFDVSKDKNRPFIVKTNLFQIQALGTSFNIKAYPDELTEETVLKEGSISLNFRAKLYDDIKVQPNQRVVFSKPDKDYKVQEVNVEDYISWIEGMFVFKEQRLDVILKRVSRYYNIEILTSKEIAETKISGKLDLKNNYDEVLQNLALISNGSYAIQDNKIYFRNKN
jgi:uncharacterized protein (UPF0147 family)